MLLGGLWHGANIRFVIWGGIHGISLAIHKVWTGVFPSGKGPSPLWKRAISAVSTFHIVCLSWVFFRAESIEKAWDMLRQMGTRFGWQSFGSILWSYLPIISIAGVALAIHWLPVSWKEYYRGAFISTPLWLKLIITLLVALVIFQFKSAELQPFIYFRF
jgi:hypothetical protein